jgi:hypothetical protein
MPSSQQRVAMGSQISDNITQFVRRKSAIGGNSKIVEPKLRFLIARTYMNVSGLIALV